MTKFFIILMIIFGSIYVGLKLLKRFIQKQLSQSLGNFSNTAQQSQKNDNKKDVLYSKDDIVVLKGEAKE